eukprot:PhF_6_TR14886/c0_g1_i1/m.23201/K16073/ALR, MNR; magnesium transporter
MTSEHNDDHFPLSEMSGTDEGGRHSLTPSRELTTPSPALSSSDPPVTSFITGAPVPRQLIAPISTISPAELAPKKHFWALSKAEKGNQVKHRTLTSVAEAASVIRDVLIVEDAAEAAAPQPEDPEDDIHILGIHEAMWIDVQGATTTDLTVLADACRLTPLTVEDLVTGDTPDKIEYLGEYFFCVLSSDRAEGISRIAIVLTERLVVTFHENASWVVVEGMSRLQSMRLTMLTPEAIFYVLLDTVVDTVVERVKKFQLEADSLDEIVLMITEQEQSDTFRRLTSTRKCIGQLRTQLYFKETIVKTVLSPQYSSCFKLRQNYHDVMDNVTQSGMRIESARDVITQANNNVVSILSMRTAEHANRTNDVMKRLTMFGGVIMPMTLVTGIFGMNVRVPYQVDTSGNDNTNAFWAIMASMGLFIILVWVVYKLPCWSSHDDRGRLHNRGALYEM